MAKRLLQAEVQATLVVSQAVAVLLQEEFRTVPLLGGHRQAGCGPGELKRPNAGQEPKRCRKACSPTDDKEGGTPGKLRRHR